MTRSAVFIFVTVCTTLLSITLFLSGESEREETLIDFCKLTRMVTPALSVNRFAPRERFFPNHEANIYLFTPPIKTLDFVYAR